MGRMKKSIFPVLSRPSIEAGRPAVRASRIGVVLLLWLAFCGVRAATDERVTQQYAPSRFFDILHYQLDVTPDFAQRSLEGVATLKFKPVGQPLDELRLDAVDLRVNGLTSSEKLLGWQSSTSQIIVTFDSPIPVDKASELVIRYHATPTNGLFFRTPELGYKASDTHLFSQGEAITARNWYPCYDAPNAKFTSEIVCHVPEGMVALANGRLVSEEKDPRTGLVAFRWLQEKPHATYLMALAAGYFMKIDDRHGNVPLAFYTPASQIAYARGSFAGTVEMMGFFEKETGVPYPWAKYYQVSVDDFVAGGMENTSLTILTGHTLHTPEFENLRDSQGLVAHELAHQWFGDLVTCKDWANLWLNEGFATYYEELYEGHRHGREALLYRMFESAESIARQAGDTNAIVRRDFNHPDDQFSYRAYGKGGWVLHMLRAQLGEDLYRRCVKTYLERYAYGNVVTDNFSGVIEELSGRSFDQFFDQWVYRGGYPQIEVDYAWDETARTAKLSVRQTQPVSEAQPLFRLPLPIRFKSKSGAVDRQVLVTRAAEDFTFALSEKPDLVLVDPLVTVLAKIAFRPPGPMLEAQMANDAEVIGRLLAIEPLAARKDHQAIVLLQKALNHDSFYAVRLEASKALRGIHTDETLNVLLASVDQKDARVRRQVVADLGGFYRETVLDYFLKVLREEKNPDILAEAITRLGAYPRPEVKGILTNLLFSRSFHNMLADSAVVSIRAQDDPAFIPPLLQALRSREQDFTPHGFAAGLETLAWLSRRQDNKDEVREFLTRQTSQARKTIQQAALNALGTLGDLKAMPVLQTFTTAKESPERSAAERAMEAIRAAGRPAAEPGTLRREVLDLQRENKTLRTDLDALKKQVETKLQARPATNAPAAPKPVLRAKPVKQ